MVARRGDESYLQSKRGSLREETRLKVLELKCKRVIPAKCSTNFSTGKLRTCEVDKFFHPGLIRSGHPGVCAKGDGSQCVSIERIEARVVEYTNFAFVYPIGVFS